MSLTLKALLLLAAVFVFVLALFLTSDTTKLTIAGLALVAGALLVEEIGFGRRRRLVR